MTDSSLQAVTGPLDGVGGPRPPEDRPASGGPFIPPDESEAPDTVWLHYQDQTQFPLRPRYEAGPLDVISVGNSVRLIEYSVVCRELGISQNEMIGFVTRHQIPCIQIGSGLYLHLFELEAAILASTVRWQWYGMGSLYGAIRRIGRIMPGGTRRAIRDMMKVLTDLYKQTYSKRNLRREPVEARTRGWDMRPLSPPVPDVFSEQEFLSELKELDRQELMKQRPRDAFGRVVRADASASAAADAQTESISG